MHPVRSEAAAVARSARYAVRSRLSTTPPYLSLVGRGKHRDEALRDGTDVVIDGFPRCANTFATIAFQVAQPRSVRIAHHLHAPAHLIAAARAEIPAILLVREPVDAVLSEAIREQPVRVGTVLSAYLRFYEHVLPFLDAFTVGEFRVVTTAFGRVIEALNARSGTAFDIFEHDEPAVQLVFALIDERERRPTRKHVDRFLAGDIPLWEVVQAAQALDRLSAPTVAAEHAVPRPSIHRDGLKHALRREIEARHLRPTLRRAQAIYERVATT